MQQHSVRQIAQIIHDDMCTISPKLLLISFACYAYYKPEFPDRDDQNWLKTTKAYFAPDADEPRFDFEAVDTSLLQPRVRKY